MPGKPTQKCGTTIRLLFINIGCRDVFPGLTRPNAKSLTLAFSMIRENKDSERAVLEDLQIKSLTILLTDTHLDWTVVAIHAVKGPKEKNSLLRAATFATSVGQVDSHTSTTDCFGYLL